MVVPENYVRDVEKLAQNLFICPSTIAQHAALAAFKMETLEILEARRSVFSERRTHMLDGLRSLGFEIPAEPNGAFYIYADCKRFCDDSHVFADELLTKAGVAITSGKDFGANLASSHVRFAYTSDISQLDEALGRIRRYLA